MDNLRFGTTARRRSRRQRRLRRLALTIWALSTAAVLVGAPVTRTTAVGLVQDIAVQDADTETSEVRAGAALVPGPPRPTDPSTEATLGYQDKGKLPSPVTRPLEERTDDAVDSSAGSVVGIIHAAAAEFGVDGDYLVSIAECESGLDPRAYNPAGYHGLFQYSDSTWSSFGYGSIWDPVAQARTTAKLIAGGGSSHWPNCA